MTKPSIERVSESRCFEGRQIVYKHASSACACTMRFAVYLPPAAERGPVPALYWLSGLTCTEENFSVKAGAQRYAAELGLALIIPDTSPRGVNIPGEDAQMDVGTGAGFYVNATEPPWAAHYRMYDYIRDELPAVVNANLPVDPARKSISGHSMGGHGAIIIGVGNAQSLSVGLRVRADRLREPVGVGATRADGVLGCRPPALARLRRRGGDPREAEPARAARRSRHGRPLSRAAARRRAQGGVQRVGPASDLSRARRLRSRLLLRQHVHRRALAVSCCRAALRRHGLASDSPARGSRARRRAVARRSRSLGPPQRERDGARERRRGRPAVRAHGAAEGARAARLRRVLHELRLAQERRALVDGAGGGRALLARARAASSLRRTRRALARTPRATPISRAGRWRAKSTRGAASRAARSWIPPRSRSVPPRSRPPSPPIGGSLGPTSGAGSGCGSRPSSSGSKAATAFTNACATSAGSTRETRTPSSPAAGARSACNPSGRDTRDSVRDDHLSVLLGVHRDRPRSLGRRATASRRLLGLLSADRRPL